MLLAFHHYEPDPKVVAVIGMLRILWPNYRAKTNERKKMSVIEFLKKKEILKSNLPVHK